MNRFSPRGYLPAARRIPCASLLFSAAAVGLYFFPQANEWLQYDRIALATGQAWRIVTCHWIHFSADHLFWDALCLAALGFLCEERSRKRFWICLAASVILIPLGLWVFLPDLVIYRGLSGLDSALFVLLIAEMGGAMIRERHRVGLAVLVLLSAAFLGKTAYEIWTGSTLFVDNAAAGFTPVPLAHLAGALAGLLAAHVPWKCTETCSNPPLPSFENQDTKEAVTVFHTLDLED